MATEHNYPAATNGGDAPLEKDFSHSQNGFHNEHLGEHLGSDEALRRIRTAGSISISPELFEKIYLSPQNAVKGDLRKTVGNPTPLALVGFLLSLSPLSCILMGWRGAGGSGASGTATYFFFGGVLMLMGGLGEWIIGNTFPFVVFCSFGAFWLSFGGTLQPFFNAYGAYSTDPTNPAAGLTTVGFNSSFAFFLLAMGLLCFIFLILALRTNVVFCLIFATLVVAFSCLAGGYWQMSNGNMKMSSDLIITGGAFTFVTCACGWWIFFAIMLAALDFPFQLPVGDLSTMIKGASEKMRADNNV
ncbi:GPR1/FUN34/yaaH protein [Neofusicoccum parvum]|uniref:GPR1/FUN34/yaaH protein n=1 Tax=Neofusicoccum parvum TaxID=310453 RepID=A0ACB5SFJ8_9PEZI|nr:GPR1/FUN34/yaaH protein [Neofusicoccum parvum]